MDLFPVRFTQLLDGEFSALERLSLSQGCGVTELFSLVNRCPRLRMLKVTAGDISRCNIVRIHSVSLEELELTIVGDNECQGIEIITFALKKLRLIVRATIDLRISIIFGFWSLSCMRSEPIESYKCKDDVVLNNKGENACSQVTRSHVLSLDISAPVCLFFVLLFTIYLN
jgi:hypothetical protein